MKQRRYPKYVTAFVDRHGTLRLRFRRTGAKTRYFKSAYGTGAFEAEYRQYLGELPLAAGAPEWPSGSVGELVSHFYQSTVWAGYAFGSRKKYSRILDRFTDSHGLRSASRMKAIHVDAILAGMIETPAAAADLRKALGRVWRWGKKFGLVPENVIADVDTIKQRKGGHYTWTDADIDQFCEFHGEGSKAWLMLMLAVWTGGRRSELHTLGPENVTGDWLVFYRMKNDDEHRVPLAPALASALQFVSKDQVAFIAKHNGEPYTAESFSNLFNDYRKEAGLERGSLHGLRKTIATRLARSGASDAEGMAVLGHLSAQTFAKYRAAADRDILAANAMQKVVKTANHSAKVSQSEGVND